MSWILASLILFLSSVALYLFIRKSQLLKVPNALNNLAMFAVPCLIYLVLNMFQRNSLSIPTWFLFLIILSAFFFSYLGNIFSLVSIKEAPNPGYSLIISKSYVTFTTLAAIPLFGSELTLKNSMAIILIVIFSALIMISKENNKKVESKKWLLYSFGAYFAWGFLALMSKYLLNQGINVLVYLFYLSLFASIFILTEIKIKKVKVNIKPDLVKLILLIGLFSMFFNLFIQVGYVFAPNPGYINAVNASSISLVTLASAYFFKDELTLRKIVGVFGVTAGLILLFV